MIRIPLSKLNTNTMPSHPKGSIVNRYSSTFSNLRFSAEQQDDTFTQKAISLVNLETDELGRTPLHRAVYEGQASIVKKLLFLPGFNVNAQDKKGMTALALALQMGSANMAELILTCPEININIQDKLGRTPLIWACKEEQDEIVEKLLASPHLNLNAKDYEGMTALNWACQKNRIRMIEKFIETPGVDINAKNPINGRSVLAWACRNNKVHIVEHILNLPEVNIESLDKFNRTPLYLASVSGNEEIVERLLKCPGIFVNAQDKAGKTPFISAAYNGHMGVIEKLMAVPGIDVFAKDGEALSAFSYSVRNGHENIVARLLIIPGMNVNQPDQRGRTPLSIACEEGRDTIVEKLLTVPGIDVNAKDHDGTSALMWACKNRHEKIVEKLLTIPGIDMNTKDHDGVSALMWALLSGSNTIPRLILSKLGRLELDKIEKEMEILGRDLTLQNPSNEGSLAFVSLLPQFLLNRSLRFLSYLFTRIENSFDAIVSHRNYYPNEAELLALLKHPELMGRDPEKMRPLTQCLTSISHFVDFDAQLTDQTLKDWADIGFLTHGFRLWLYDTLGEANSLLAHFGFQPAPTPRPFNEVFGKGFLYSDKETGLTLEFRRGYLLATHPEHGTLVIRNSSPVFGRDLLKHPAYYLKKSLTPQEILTFDPRTMNDLDSILHHIHYPSNLNDGDERSAHGISNLTQGIVDLNTRYRKFKLDTEAFERGEFIGHLVPGLPKIINVLNRLQSKKTPLPDLAFVQPEYLPYQPYFYRDADMKRVDRFPLTPLHLKELNDFVTGQWSPEKYLESNWIRFLQQAGVENRGELVMLAPEKSSSGLIN